MHLPNSSGLDADASAGQSPVAFTPDDGPLAARRPGRIRRFFGPAPFEERLRVVATSAAFRVYADDDGTLEVQLTLANMCRRSLTIERFHCEHWLWNGVLLPSMEPHFRGIGSAVPRRGFAECWLTFHPGTGIVRRIRSATPPAANVFSSVEARIEILGRMWFRRRGEPMWLRLAPPNAHVVTPWREPLKQEMSPCP